MTTLLPDAVGFQSDARRIDERRPPWIARATLRVLVVVIIVAGVWAALAKVDRIVVAPGTLVDPHRTGDVLQRLFAQILKIDVEAAGGVFLHPLRDADAAGVGEGFEVAAMLTPPPKMSPSSTTISPW